MLDRRSFLVSSLSSVIVNSYAKAGNMSADVRFSNDTSQGFNGFRLSPHNGNSIRVYDPTAAAWVTRNITNGGIQGVVSNCYIDDVTAQNMPNSVLHFAYLKMNGSGNLYVNWLPDTIGGYTRNGPEGFPVDARTGHGHLIGMAYRDPTHSIQGQYWSEFLISWYNRGTAEFFSHPQGTVTSAQGWQSVGQKVQCLNWEDEWPAIIAILELECTNANVVIRGRLVANGDPSPNGTTSGPAGNPVNLMLKYPGAPLTPGLWTYQVWLWVSAGSVTATANSQLGAYGKF